jgi:cyclase
MLKTRVMPTLLYKDFGLVKGAGFDSWRRVGSVMQAVKVYNMRQVDELVFLDIRATVENRRPDFTLVDEIADECFMPLTVGGGVRSVDDVRRLLQVGADKVAVNTAAVEEPSLISAIADRFGSQCVVVSIDFRIRPDGSAEVCTRCGTQCTGLDPARFAAQAEQLGAGEILLTSIERDGTMRGYDLPITKAVAAAVSIPVIASGGAGSCGHVSDMLRETEASAAAMASLFHYTQCTPIEVKSHLAQNGFHVRT